MGFVLLSAACSGDGEKEGEPGAAAMGQGSSECGAFRCEAGQHCSNAVCVNGCLSNQNCAANQTCLDIDDVTKIGVCRNDAQAAAKDCETFCDKARACQDPEAGSCHDICTASSLACVSCVNDSNCGDGCEEACF